LRGSAEKSGAFRPASEGRGRLSALPFGQQPKSPRSDVHHTDMLSVNVIPPVTRIGGDQNSAPITAIAHLLHRKISFCQLLYLTGTGIDFVKMWPSVLIGQKSNHILLKPS